MKKWIRYAVLLWLVIALAILAVATVRVFDGYDEVYYEFTGSEELEIEGKPAYLFHAFNRSRLDRLGAPAWTQRWLLALPVSEVNVPKQWEKPEEYWQAVAIDKPYHIIFELPDGRTTQPMRVAFTEPALAGIRSGWNHDGTRFTLHRGMPGMPQDSSMFDGRDWNRNVLWDVGLEQLMWIGLVAAGVFVLTMFRWVGEVARLRMRLHLCPRCGYDLRGSTGLKCPECGVARRDRARSAAARNDAGSN
jgi:hypothetical protein